MKLKFDCDEHYPVYFFADGGWVRWEADFTEEEIKIIEESWKLYEKAQEIFAKKYEEVKNDWRKI